MDRVYHSAWRELCEGMAAAGCLDEVIAVHDAYLLSIQRQCFVVPDKLWVLIASRINNILGLALDFYSVEPFLQSRPDVIRRSNVLRNTLMIALPSFSGFYHSSSMWVNYNNFYMFDNGNLISAPGSEAINFKLAKTTSV